VSYGALQDSSVPKSAAPPNHAQRCANKPTNDRVSKADIVQGLLYDSARSTARRPKQAGSYQISILIAATGHASTDVAIRAVSRQK
jgi:hypothetical protein